MRRVFWFCFFFKNMGKTFRFETKTEHHCKQSRWWFFKNMKKKTFQFENEQFLGLLVHGEKLVTAPPSRLKYKQKSRIKMDNSPAMAPLQATTTRKTAPFACTPPTNSSDCKIKFLLSKLWRWIYLIDLFYPFPSALNVSMPYN